MLRVAIIKHRIFFISRFSRWTAIKPAEAEVVNEQHSKLLGLLRQTRQLHDSPDCLVELLMDCLCWNLSCLPARLPCVSQWWLQVSLSFPLQVCFPWHGMKGSSHESSRVGALENNTTRIEWNLWESASCSVNIPILHWLQALLLKAQSLWKRSSLLHIHHCWFWMQLLSPHEACPWFQSPWPASEFVWSLTPLSRTLEQPSHSLHWDLFPFQSLKKANH